MKNDQRKSDNPEKRGKRGSLDIGQEAVGQTEGEIDSQSKHAEEIAPDDVVNTKGMKEAARQRRDTFVVDSDLEDEDQREAAPGTREQD